MPVYLRQTANDLTGEHTCVMLRSLDSADSQAGLAAYARDFQGRWLRLLAYQFKSFPAVLALSIDESANAGAKQDAELNPKPLTKDGLDSRLSPYDLKRLESYAGNKLDHHVVTDLMPIIAMLYFNGEIKSDVKLTGVQQAILLAVGLQHKDMDEVGQELGLHSSQMLAMFMKVMRKVAGHLSSLVSGAMQKQLEDENPMGNRGEAANNTGVLDVAIPSAKAPEEGEDKELDEQSKQRRKMQRELIDSLPLDQ